MATDMADGVDTDGGVKTFASDFLEPLSRMDWGFCCPEMDITRRGHPDESATFLTIRFCAHA